MRQSYSNLELILVDDGSKDESLEICNKYLHKDKRVVVPKENGETVLISDVSKKIALGCTKCGKVDIGYVL